MADQRAPSACPVQAVHLVLGAHRVRYAFGDLGKRKIPDGTNVFRRMAHGLNCRNAPTSIAPKNLFPSF
eukprot:5314316-Pyramimonas_sp.AAC.1